MSKHPLRPLACALLGLHLGLLGACSSNAGALPAEPSAAPQQQQLQSFAEWRQQLRQEALLAGIDANLFDRAFAGIAPDPKVIAADRSQPEFSRPVWEYLDGAVSPSRIKRGRGLLLEHRDELRRIHVQYGVQKEVLVAIWGMESAFGSHIGNYNVVRSLATLAYEGRRAAFWREQLLAALQILQHGDTDPQHLLGSWAGAMGQTQFMPTTYNQYAVDFDGDGRRDVWGSSADALASAANYLGKSGWQAGKTWGFPVALPSGFDHALADPSIRKSYDEWLLLGIKGQPGAGIGGEDRASLLLPAGHRGPAFLVFGNFNSILRYNNSTSYALAIGLLADALRGQLWTFQWPRDDRPLSRSERMEMQERLAARGFDPGQPDGIIGANTRKAIRAFQLQQGWPADGYPNPELLEMLRR